MSRRTSPLALVAGAFALVVVGSYVGARINSFADQVGHRLHAERDSARPLVGTGSATLAGSPWSDRDTVYGRVAVALFPLLFRRTHRDYVARNAERIARDERRRNGDPGLVEEDAQALLRYRDDLIEYERQRDEAREKDCEA